MLVVEFSQDLAPPTRMKNDKSLGKVCQGRVDVKKIHFRPRSLPREARPSRLTLGEWFVMLFSVHPKENRERQMFPLRYR